MSAEEQVDGNKILAESLLAQVKISNIILQLSELLL
jgi:hypothetical protein